MFYLYDVIDDQNHCKLHVLPPRKGYSNHPPFSANSAIGSLNFDWSRGRAKKASISSNLPPSPPSLIIDFKLAVLCHAQVSLFGEFLPYVVTWSSLLQIAVILVTISDHPKAQKILPMSLRRPSTLSVTTQAPLVVARPAHAVQVSLPWGCNGI